MGDESLTPKPDDDLGPLGLDVTTKKCPACGEGYTGESHKGCVSDGGTLKKPASSKSRLDELPAEASAIANDPGRQLNQYLLVKQIGKGGMGAVWKAWDKKLTRWVAIKFLLAGEEEDVLRFQREAKLAARLRHPNIAPIYEVGEAPAMQAGQSSRHYLAMEYIDGQSMASALNLPQNELLDLFIKIAQGVEAAHKAGVVHRDLKPQNVMLTSDRWPYVMDFGLAKALQTESSLSVSGAVMGTPAYMPPEQAQGQLDQVDAQSDVYSLGATMYAILCRQQPFTGQAPMEILMKVCKEEPQPPRKLNPEIPEAVEKIILKAMAKEKVDRYASAAALAEDLKRFRNNEEITAKGPSSLKLAARKAKKNLRPIAVGLVVLVAGGVITFLATRPKPPEKPPEVAGNNLAKTPSPEEDAAAKADRERKEKEEADRIAREKADKDKRDREDADRRAREKREADWLDEWVNKVKPGIDLVAWKPGDKAAGDSAKKLFDRMDAEAAARDASLAVDFIRSQVQQAVSASSSLGTDRERASAMVAWCDMITEATQGAARLKGHTASLAPVRQKAAGIAAYRGKFALQVVVGPYAEVKLSREGKEIPLDPRATPLVVRDLEIGDYEVELSHPQLGKKQIKIAASELKENKSYRISGLMSDPAALKPRELP